jgi:transcriptional regulator with XRE-family HTH domain
MLARRGMNKSELARRLNVSHTWVTNRLTGYQDISLNDLERIAEVLGVTIADLLPRSARAGTNGSSTTIADRPVPHAVRVTSPRGATRSATRRPARTDRPLHTVSDRSPVVV